MTISQWMANLNEINTNFGANETDYSHCEMGWVNNSIIILNI